MSPFVIYFRYANKMSLIGEMILGKLMHLFYWCAQFSQSCLNLNYPINFESRWETRGYSEYKHKKTRKLLCFTK